VVILRLERDIMRIDTWLMSCRVLERGVEQAVLNEIVRMARKASVRFVVGEYIATPRNGMVKEHYSKLGFQALDPTERKLLTALDPKSEAWRLNVLEYIEKNPVMQVTWIDPLSR